MSESPQPPTQPLVDPGNPFLGGSYPAHFQFGFTQDRKNLIMTVRSGPATLTVMMDKGSADKFIADASLAKAHLTDLIVPDGFILNGH